jgi:hypothetical protein
MQARSRVHLTPRCDRCRKAGPGLTTPALFIPAPPAGPPTGSRSQATVTRSAPPQKAASRTSYHPDRQRLSDSAQNEGPRPAPSENRTKSGHAAPFRGSVAVPEPKYQGAQARMVPLAPSYFLPSGRSKAASLPGAKNLTQRARSDDEISYLCRGRRKARLRRPSGRYAFRWKVPLKRMRFREPPLPAPSLSSPFRLREARL